MAGESRILKPSAGGIASGISLILCLTSAILCLVRLSTPFGLSRVRLYYRPHVEHGSMYYPSFPEPVIGVCTKVLVDGRHLIIERCRSEWEVAADPDALTKEDSWDYGSLSLAMPAMFDRNRTMNSVHAYPTWTGILIFGALPLYWRLTAKKRAAKAKAKAAAAAEADKA